MNARQLLQSVTAKQKGEPIVEIRDPRSIQIGDTLVCAETGKSFVAARDGCSFNYAVSCAGEVLSNEGVNIRDSRGLLDRSKPYYAYISSDGKHVTGWKGFVLGTVTEKSSVRLTRLSYTHGKYISAITVRDIHGGLWYGRGSPGVSITLRAKKGK